MTYPSPAFREDRSEVLHPALRALHFGLLVTQADSGFQTSYLPWMLDADLGAHGTLVGHLARYNPQWQTPVTGAPALVVFQGPHAYLSPAWYPGKQDDPRQVPTWDYLTIEARGTLTAFDDDDRLYALLLALTERNEAAHKAPRWHVSDAPDDYVRREMRHIVGIELAIDSLIGRYKLSQNRDRADQEGARAALADSGIQRERDLAAAIAAVQSERRD